MSMIEHELEILKKLYKQEISHSPNDELEALLKSNKISKKALVASLDFEKNMNWEYSIFYELSGLKSGDDNHEVVEQAIDLMQRYIERIDWISKLERILGLTSNMYIYTRTVDQDKAITTVLYAVLARLNKTTDVDLENKIDVWEQLRDYGAITPFDCSLLKEKLLFSTHQINSFTERCTSGFFGSTLVHTRESLKTISSLKIGDWVYTQNRRNTGEIMLQQITKLLPHKAPLAFLELKEQSSERNGKNKNFLFTTRMQPFWSNRLAWTTLADLPSTYLSEPQNLKTITGDSCFQGSEMRVFATKSERYGWMLTSMELAYCGMGGDGVLWDFQNMQEILRAESPDLHREMTDSAEKLETEYFADVYDLEVGDTHTYFVSKAGVWVHDAKIEGSGRISRLLNPRCR